MELDFRAMESCIELLKGVHDFSRFAGKIENGKSTYREIYEASIDFDDDQMLFEFEGSSFLPHQVRRMVGALVDVGKGALLDKQFREMLRGSLGGHSRCLPAEGLCLIAVNYNENVNEGEK